MAHFIDGFCLWTGRVVWGCVGMLLLCAVLDGIRMLILAARAK